MGRLRGQLSLKKYREPLVKASGKGRKFCVIGILPRLCENEEWWSREMCKWKGAYIMWKYELYLFRCMEDFVDSLKLYKQDGVHLYDKWVDVFAKKMDEC